MNSPKENPKNPEIKPEPLPRLHLPQSFLDAVIKETLAHPQTETGGYIFGLRYRTPTGDYLLAPLGSFTPAHAQDIFREGGFLRLAGQGAADFDTWLLGHWPYILKDFLSRYDKPDHPISGLKPEFLGCWHRHPGNYIQYSQEDDSTIQKSLRKSMPDYLFPIIIIRPPKPFLGNLAPPINPDALRLTPNPNTALDMVFYYRRRNQRSFTHYVLPPHIHPSNEFPDFVSAPWYIQAPHLLEAELAALEKIGAEVTPQPFIPKGKTKIEIWFRLAHPDLPQTVYFHTPVDFDKSRVIDIRFDNPRQTPDGKALTLTLPRNTGTRIADIVSPVISYIKFTTNGTQPVLKP